MRMGVDFDLGFSYEPWTAPFVHYIDFEHLTEYIFYRHIFRVQPYCP